MVSTRLLSVAAVLAVASTSVNAHGGMFFPASRAVRTMGLSIDSTFGHPIDMRASYTNCKGGNCLDFIPDSNLQPLPYGESKIKMRVNFNFPNNTSQQKINIMLFKKISITVVTVFFSLSSSADAQGGPGGPMGPGGPGGPMGPGGPGGPSEPPSAGSSGKFVSVDQGPLKAQMDTSYKQNCKAGFCPPNVCKSA